MGIDDGGGGGGLAAGSGGAGCGATGVTVPKIDGGILGNCDCKEP
ncbi:MAG: hypothetical protein WBF33_33240 [Candidatus Nitrosopolaris sp.]